MEIARGVGAILCDEVYRHLTQEDEWCESIVDLYEKGISVSSMSKVFSLAGLRMGWIATHDEAARKAFLSHRDYNLISCGMFDDAIASIALRHSDVMLKRNQRIVRENLAILDDWIKGKSALFLHQAQKPVRPRSFTTISISPPTSFVSACTTRPVRSSRRATASSSPTACASATPATSTRSETALPR